MEMVKTYPGKISYLLPMLFFPVYFFIAIFLEGNLKTEFLYAVILLLVPFLIFIFIPLGYKLEIGNGFIRESFLDFTLKKISVREVESFAYGGIGMWGGVYLNHSPIHGKGLAILSYINGIRKTFGISEKLYGKRAIEDVKALLESDRK